MAHTPGPWSIEVRPHRVSIICGPDVPSTDEINWRLYRGTKDFDNDFDAERIANARLIAAAPDLLKACKEALREADMSLADQTYYEQTCAEITRRTVELLAAAIAKAEPAKDPTP